MSERWRPIVNYEGWYEISDIGRTKRVMKANNTFVGRILTPRHTRGYLTIVLHKDGVRGTYLIHRLVIAAFVGPCPDGKQVHHKDANKWNNCIENLEYVTSSENALHACKLGLMVNHVGEEHGMSKLTEKNIHAIRKLFGTMTHKEIGILFNVTRQTITSIYKGDTWSSVKEEEEEDND